VKKPYRIVIAEDHTILREGLRSLLSSNPDFDVAGEAEDGRDAVRSIRKFKPDLVVLNHATDIRLSTLEKFAKAVGKQIHVALI
jgi:DNA-binding NarL/FixJ family response regulator